MIIKVHERFNLPEVPVGVVLYVGKTGEDAERALAAVYSLYPETKELASTDSRCQVILNGDFDTLTEIVEDYEKYGIKKLVNTSGTEKDGWLDAWFSVKENLELYKGTHIGKLMEDALVELSGTRGVVWVDLMEGYPRYASGKLLMGKDSVDAVNKALDGKYIQVRSVYSFSSRRGAEWFSSTRAVEDAAAEGYDYGELYGVVLEMFGSDLRDRTTGSQFRIRSGMVDAFEPSKWV